ncbi:MAG: hypothetical protein ACI8ZM_000855 [Crocinitomix sp.]|jgi:hypothetical protein
MNRFIICVITLFSAQMAMSQLQFGINTKAGIGEMKKIPSDNDFLSNNIIESQPAATWGISALATKTFFEKLNLTLEVGYNNIKGVEEEVFFVTAFEDGSVTTYETETTRNAHYLSVPLSVEYKIAPKVWLGVGASANYLITNSTFFESRVNKARGLYYGTGNDLNRLDIGLHAQASVNLSDHFTLVAKANWGMLNTRTPGTGDALSTFFNFIEPQQFEVKNRQFTLGITYNLLFKK